SGQHDHRKLRVDPRAKPVGAADPIQNVETAGAGFESEVEQHEVGLADLDGPNGLGGLGSARDLEAVGAQVVGHEGRRTLVVLEYGELRFTFNERDFTERVEQAGMKLGFVEAPLEDDEREDLVNLAVNGHVENPASALGDHVNSSWGELDGPSERSLVHWLRR